MAVPSWLLIGKRRYGDSDAGNSAWKSPASIAGRKPVSFLSDPLENYKYLALDQLADVGSWKKKKRRNKS